MPIKKAFETGVSVRACSLQMEKELKKFLLKEITRASDMIGANKTFSSNEEIIMCVDEIINSNSHLKIQEIRGVFDNLIFGRYGKFYERFKIPEVLNGLNQYQSEERALMLEERNRNFMRKSDEEMDRIIEAFESYEHKPVFAKTLREKFTSWGINGKEKIETIEEMKSGLVDSRTIEDLERKKAEDKKRLNEYLKKK